MQHVRPSWPGSSRRSTSYDDVANAARLALRRRVDPEQSRPGMTLERARLCLAAVRRGYLRTSQPSWPGLSRPSTPGRCANAAGLAQRRRVDARDKRGHDAERVRLSDLAAVRRGYLRNLSAVMAGLVPAIHAETMRKCCEARAAAPRGCPATRAGMTRRGGAHVVLISSPSPRISHANPDSSRE